MSNRIITVALPEKMYEYLMSEIEEGKYASISEVIRSYIREDMCKEISGKEEEI